MLLAQGYLKAAWRGDTLARLEKSLAAYREVLELNPALAGDRTMLDGLRYYAAKDSSAEPVLEFAAEHMGQNGADLMFDVWQATSLKTLATEKAGELLDTAAVRRQMSEALRLALELRQPKSCDDIKALLPRIEQHADRRSVLSGEGSRKDHRLRPGRQRGLSSLPARKLGTQRRAHSGPDAPHSAFREP